MKVKFLLLLSLLNINTFSQVVTENVTFDNQNDFPNFFINYSTTALIQDTANGIANSGSLTTPNTNSGHARFCSKYKNTPGSVTKTSICFKYNSTLVNTNSSNSAAGIYLYPTTNGNHYIMTYIRQNKRLEIYCYSWASANDTTVIPNLLDNHWYKLQLTTTIVGGNFGDQIEILTEVFELGLNGTGAPVLMNSILKTNYYDITFAQDLAVEVNFGGSKWGGSGQLDNFSFEGVKSADSCNANSTNIYSIDKSASPIIYPNPFSNQLNFSIADNEQTTVSLYDYLGQHVLQQTLTNSLTLNTEQLSSGIYFLQIAGKQGNIIDTRKIIKQ